MDTLSNDTRKEFQALAAKHPSLPSFMRDVEKFAQMVWHNVRNDGTQQAAQEAQAQDNASAEVPQP